MTDQKIDGGKRTWIIASGCAGAVGAGFLAVPFVRSFEPSDREPAYERGIVHEAFVIGAEEVLREGAAGGLVSLGADEQAKDQLLRDGCRVHDA